MENTQNKNSQAKIKANNKYKKTHYSTLSISLKPEIIADIKAVASAEGLSIAQYIVNIHNEHKNGGGS